MAVISVIIPMYNVEKYIKGCLQSVAAQTFCDFECVCIDDGSPDKSAKIAEKFALTDARFTVIHQKNGGLSDARNTGMHHSTAPYVFFLDSDDYIHPKTLETLYNLIQKTGVKVANCGVQNTAKIFDEALEDIDISRYKTEIISNPLNAFLKRRDIKTGVCFRLYARQVIQDIPFIKGVHFEDVAFTTQLLNQIDKMAFINAPLYYYYKNPNSVMRSHFSNEKIDSYNTLIRHLSAYFIQNAPEKLPTVQCYLFNQRIKMMFNQCVRKQKDKTKQTELFQYAQPIVQKLYQDKLISYKHLKIKHKIALWLILNHTAKAANWWCRLMG